MDGSITFTKIIDTADDDIRLEVEIKYTYQRATADHFVPGGSWDQGEGASVDIHGCRVLKFLHHVRIPRAPEWRGGEYVEVPVDAQQGKKIGAYLLDQHRTELESELLREHENAD